MPAEVEVLAKNKQEILDILDLAALVVEVLVLDQVVHLLLLNQA
jgi:hypothetical protein